jgi:hypothetical protein
MVLLDDTAFIINIDNLDIIQPILTSIYETI